MKTLNFKTFIENSENKINKIHQILDRLQFVFYFSFDGSVFGAPEESRIAFVKIKHPNRDEKKESKDLNFSAINLSGIMDGQGSQRIFDKKDCNKLKILDKEDAVKKLSDQEKK